MARGGKSQVRRRARRAADRRVARGRETALSQTATATLEEDGAAFAALLDAALIAAAQGGSFPLGERNEAWDGAAAEKSYDLPADASSYMWKDPDGDASAKSSYKLAFVSKDGGKHAVWAAVTAIAAILQGGRGGVDIPAADEAAVKTKVEGYYAKARTKYDDDSIKVPWDKSESAADDVETMAVVPEIEALLRLDAFQNGVRCDCGHPFSEHIGSDGPCKHEDGRGTCSCGSFAEMAAEQPEGTPEPTLASRARVVFAVGDVSWGPEDGFVDLLCDINELLGLPDDGPYAGEVMSWDAPRAVDVSVKLDKALICAGDDYYVAAIQIGADGEPVLADRDTWTSVEEGWIEVDEEPEEDEAMVASAPRIRGILSEFVFAVTETDDGATQEGMLPADALPDDHQPGERIPRRNPSPGAPASQVVTAGSRVEWEAVFVPEATLTEDRRAFAPGALEWRDLPLSLMAMIETQDGHDGATLAGRIDSIWRDGTIIRAGGVFDTGEFGADIARLVGDGTLRGLSVDIAPLEWFQSPVTAWFDADGNWIGERDEEGNWVPAGGLQNDNATVEDLFAPMATIITKGVIGMATVCPFPAFAQANISLVAGASHLVRLSHQARFITVARSPVDGAAEEPDASQPVEALTAAAVGAAPEAPPVEWFSDPEFEQLTPLTIDDDGRISGHAWAWGTCHLSFDECVTAPHTETGYAYFHLGEVVTEENERLAVGKVTLDTRHAGPRLSRVDASAHYDNTGTVAAYVRVGEDEFGGWVTGSVAGDLTEEKLRLLRGSTLSGDWRAVNGNLELVALLAVNVPGFPVPRALVASGVDDPEVYSLVAAGIVVEETDADVEADIRALGDAL